ncbi:GntR family transcriptional regulator [Halalkalibacterium ligniniphilum]|uniref:GntR family transcriptional regulator n=1 Tax=Halalkalibacterium ligniniphilum TaxID=1134413 RepID=UPI00036B6C7E|nr:GntR family transcriptional regulator [Halalkalibacterium ligniniphilum]
MNINFNTKEPRYIQIVRYFIYQIINGKLIPGESIPSRRELASILGVNVNTVQRAYSELERQKIIVTELGKGSYIENNHLRIKQIRTSLINNSLDTFLKQIEPLNVDYDELVTLIKEKYYSQS